MDKWPVDLDSKVRNVIISDSYHHRFDNLFRSGELRHVVKEVCGDWLQGGAGPLAEPVDGAAVYQRWKLTQPRPEYLQQQISRHNTKPNSL